MDVNVLFWGFLHIGCVRVCVGGCVYLVMRTISRGLTEKKEEEKKASGLNVLR